MKFEAMSGTIRGLFTSTRTYKIPRFQRDFSWEKTHYLELFNDLLDQISIKEESDPQKQFENSQYFLGNMLFFGEKDRAQVDVVDGQQRLTTATILLAAIRNSLYTAANSAEYDKDDRSKAKSYAETIQKEYLIKEIDGEVMRKLETSSSYPYFTRKIQEYNCTSSNIVAETEEEEGIEEAFTIFLEQLEPEKFIKSLKNKVNAELADKLNLQAETHYIPALKSLRDQLLDSEIIEVYVGDEEQANRIFENINSKGKPLTEVDLIKNAIFSKVRRTSGGVDTAHDLWKKFGQDIQEVKVKREVDIDFNEFFLHYWKGRFPSDKATGKNLYKKYMERYGNKSAKENEEFIEELRKGLGYYIKIVSPDANEFKPKQYQFERDYLQSINKFKGIQVRPAILAFYLKEEELSSKGIEVSSKIRRRFLEMLSNFHFLAFGTNLKISSNKVTKPYQDFAKSLDSVTDNNELQEKVKELGKVLFKDIDEESVKEAFKDMKYPSKKSSGNQKDTKSKAYSISYVLNEISNKLDKRTYVSNESSIEHIIDESVGSVDHIGNLTVLEERYNQELATLKQQKDTFDYSDKKETYKKSSYKMVYELLENYQTFDKNDISKRSEELASTFWRKSLKTYK